MTVVINEKYCLQTGGLQRANKQNTPKGSDGTLGRGLEFDTVMGSREFERWQVFHYFSSKVGI